MDNRKDILKKIGLVIGVIVVITIFVKMIPGRNSENQNKQEEEQNAELDLDEKVDELADEFAEVFEEDYSAEEVPEKRLSDECDKILCTGYDGADCYELVANQIDAYPESTFQFGVIKNNEWLVEMSSSCPFIDENGWWKGAQSKNTPGEFKYMNAGCFYYEHEFGRFEIIYKPETNVSFEISGVFTVYKDRVGNVDYSKLVNENGEALARLNDGNYTFAYLNLNTGESKAIPFELEVHHGQQLGLLSDGLFYACTWGKHRGFFDLNGNQIINLFEYDCVEMGDYMFHNGQYTMTCKNESGVKFNITINTSGEIIKQEKLEE